MYVTRPAAAAMPSARITLFVLIAGLAVLLVGMGLVGTLVGVRGSIEGFDGLTIGLIMSGYYFGYVLGSYLCPRVIRGVGHIRAFAAFAAAACATTLALGLLPEVWSWALLRLVGGVAMFGLYMVVESWINEQVSFVYRGRVFGLYTAATLGALAFGQFLLVAADPATLKPFAIAALFVIVGLIPIAVTRVREPQPVADPGGGLRGLYAISPLGFQGVLVAGVATSAFWGVGAVFARDIGLDRAGISGFLAATIAGGALLQWPIGHLSDRYDRRSVLIGVSIGSGVVALLALEALRVGFAALVATAFLYGGLLFSLYSISVAHANDHLEPGRILEATRGLLLVFGFGAIAGPTLAGAVMDGVGPSGMLLVSATFLVLLGVFGLYRVTRRPAPPLEEQVEFVPMVRTTQAAVEMLPQADPEPELDLEVPPEEGTPR
jgi:MFS family permease